MEGNGAGGGKGSLGGSHLGKWQALSMSGIGEDVRGWEKQER